MAEFIVGQKVRLLASIYDDGADHHPPGWLAMKGEVLIVRGLCLNGDVRVSHEDVTDNCFRVTPQEIGA